MGTSSNGPGSSIKIELGSKEAESYYNRKDNRINNDYSQLSSFSTSKVLVDILVTVSLN